jgi:hypothetical protein
VEVAVAVFFLIRGCDFPKALIETRTSCGGWYPSRDSKPCCVRHHFTATDKPPACVYRQQAREESVVSPKFDSRLRYYVPQNVLDIKIRTEEGVVLHDL